jgi:fibronectin-binding autotransporter adhesin
MEKEMKTKSRSTGYIVYGIAAAMLLLTAQISLAGSATWLLSPQDSAWENANNWTVGGPPNGPSDIATFAGSSQGNVNISTSEEVNSIVFTSSSAAYVFSIGACNGASCGGQLIISGTGVNNNSSVQQHFQAANSGQIIFNNASTAASASIANSSADVYDYGDIGRTFFNGASTADHASISNNGAGGSHGFGGWTTFNDTSTAANASIDNFESRPASTAERALTIFNDASTAGHATITNHGGDFGGGTIFSDSSTADSAILIATGGEYGSGAIFFSDTSTGGTARVEVFDNGYLDISGHQQPGVTIGSIEGSGNVLLGANRLTVGTNNLSTSFSA